MKYKFSDITINYDSKRVPLSAKQRKERKGKYPYYGAQGIIDYIDDYIFDGKYLLIAEDVGLPYTLATEKTITEEGLAHCNSQLYPLNTVFVTARGTVGKVGLSGVPMAMNQSCYALVGKGEHQLLVYFYTLMAVERLRHKASGAVFDAITTRDFSSEQISKLSNSDTQSFLSVAEPIFKTILSMTVENQRLAELRNTLLPKLMTGEIDVSAIQFEATKV